MARCSSMSSLVRIVIMSLIVAVAFMCLVDSCEGDIWDGSDGSEEPEWVQTEREQCSTHRDRNKDGHLDKEEVSHMIKPPGYDPAFAEARHLIYAADTNKVSIK